MNACDKLIYFLAYSPLMVEVIFPPEHVLITTGYKA
jgi:hypothetical protein